MSTNDTVASDYGLTDEVPVTGRGKERRIWETTSVAPDPHQAGHFYAVQRLAGEWKKPYARYRTVDRGHPAVWWDPPADAPVEWFPRREVDAPVTRVLYCTMDAMGRMVNVNREASQGKSSTPVFALQGYEER